MEAYKSGGIADNKEDAEKLKQAEKSAEQEAHKEKQKPLQWQHWSKQSGFLHLRQCHLCGPQLFHLDTHLGQHQPGGHHLKLVDWWGHVLIVGSWATWI